jgi:hypothetical protein
MKTIKCPHCKKIFFDAGSENCPFCKKSLTLKENLNIFEDFFGDNNPFGNFFNGDTK